MGPADTGGHSAAAARVLTAQGIESRPEGHSGASVSLWCYPTAFMSQAFISHLTWEPGDAGTASPSLPSSGVTRALHCLLSVQVGPRPGRQAPQHWRASGQQAAT